jgi:hypothetical protein
MRWYATAAACVLLWIAAGCAGGDAETVALRNDTELPPAVQRREALEFLSEFTPFEERTGTRFYRAEEAPRCPQVRVETSEGQETRLDIARTGYVTLVLFWRPEEMNSQLALRHFSDLVHRYRRFRVRGMTIVARTRGAKQAPELARSMGVDLPLHYDDLSLSALREMAGAANAEEATAMPAGFIVDGRGRLRFYRPGFSFNIITTGQPPDARQVLTENAVPGKALEDYLKRILREG